MTVAIETSHKIEVASAVPEIADHLASDVGLWTALPAFGPAVIVVAVVIYVARRDRRKESDAPEAKPSSG